MMASLFERLFGRSSKADTSGKIAKDRLQFVLVQDRVKLPADQMQQMQQEILEVISKYVTVDLENVDFELANRERTGVLLAEVPFGSPIDTDTDDEDTDLIEAINMDDDEPVDALDDETEDNLGDTEDADQSEAISAEDTPDVEFIEADDEDESTRPISARTDPDPKD